MPSTHSTNSPQKHPADFSLAPLATKMLALLAVVFMLLAIYLIHRSGRAFEIQGPEKIERNADGMILISAHEKLFLIDNQQRIQPFTSTALGLQGSISSITADGDTWLLGDDGSGQLYRCTATLSSCKSLSEHPTQPMWSHAHSVVLTGEQIVITDTSRHRLRVFNLDGEAISSHRTTPIGLCYPNDLLLIDNALYISDTNNFRIARVRLDDLEHSEMVFQTTAGAPLKHANCTDTSSRIAKRGDPNINLLLDSATTVQQPTLSMARQGRIWPTALLHSSRNDWWVIQMQNGMRSGDVLLYSNEGEVRKRVALSEDADPVDLLAIDDTVLVTDPTLARIDQVTLDGTVRGEWGNAELKAQWQKILHTRAQWQRLKQLGWLLIAICLGLCTIVIVREYKRTHGDWNPHPPGILQPVTTPPQSLHATEEWLSVTPAYAKKVKILILLILILLTLFFATEGTLIFLALKKYGMLKLTILIISKAILLGGLLLWMCYSIYRSLHIRLGTNGQQLLLDLGSGKIVSSDFEQVLASGRVILVGNRTHLVYTTGNASVYPAEQLNNLILARIPQQNFVSAPRFLYATLRRGVPETWLGILILVLIALLAIIENLR